MRNTLKFLMALIVALLVMLVFRALCFTVYSVRGAGLAPDFQDGDRVMVNRWSYGLRTGGKGVFGYERFCRQGVARGDYVLLRDAKGRMLIDRCQSLPGDTVILPLMNIQAVMPSRANCALRDYYYFERLGMVTEEWIVGRIVLVLYNHRPGLPFWRGYDRNRFLLLR
jgi:signal peptidase I